MNNNHRIYPSFRNGIFLNDPSERFTGVYLKSLAMYCGGFLRRRAGFKALKKWHQDNFKPYEASSDFVKITWLGHASFLLEYADYTVITDPVFEDLTIFFPRLIKPGIPLAQLPLIDAVVVSHNHRDHMEKSTLEALARLNPQCAFFVPQGDKKHLERWGIHNVQEKLWWDQMVLTKPGALPLTITSVPALHWSQRTAFDRNESLWCGWVMEQAGHITYFAGDTRYGNAFTAIGKEFAQIDVALLPIGPCEPQKYMKISHMGPEDAVRAVQDLNAQACIPMHWGTYAFGVEAPLVPLERFKQAWSQSISTLQPHILTSGQTAGFSPLQISQTIVEPQSIVL